MSRRKTVLQRMKDLNVSQLQLAQYVVLSLNTLDLWLDSKVELPYTKLFLICDLLGFEVDDLVNKS